MTADALARETIKSTRVATFRAADGAKLHWLTIAGSAWMLGALYWDGWAHGRGLADSFWTVYHAAFYSGCTALALVIFGAAVLNRPAAGSWRAAIPTGYGWATFGAGAFALGGFLDLTWHSIVGIEQGIESLISPTHLLGGLLMAFMVGAPLRGALAVPAGGLAYTLSMVLSLTLLFSLFTFFTLFAGPYSDIIGGIVPGAEARRTFSTLERQLLGVYLFSGLLVGHALVALRARTLPVGTFTCLLGVNGLAMVLMKGQMLLNEHAVFVSISIAAGVVADGLYILLRPSPERGFALRAFAFALPFAYFGIYISVVAARFGTWLSWHSALGVPILAGVVGLLLSFLVAPPAAKRASPSP